MCCRFFQVTELECQSNQTPVIKSQKTELNQTIEELENTLRDKEEVCAPVLAGGCCLSIRHSKRHLSASLAFSPSFIVSSRKWKN